MANCPTCNTEDCYNSGFTIECINEECQYFSEKQASIVKSDRETDPPPPPEEEITLQDVYGTAGAITITAGTGGGASCEEEDDETDGPRPRSPPDGGVPRQAAGSSSGDPLPRAEDEYSLDVNSYSERWKDFFIEIREEIAAQKEREEATSRQWSNLFIANFAPPRRHRQGRSPRDANIPKKDVVSVQFIECIEQQKRVLMSAMQIPRVLLEGSVSRAVTRGLPNWLWEACHAAAKKLDKDPGDLAQEEFLSVLRPEPCTACGALFCRNLTRRCRGS